MKPIKKILVPLDFSPVSMHALEFATDLAKRYEAALDLVYAYQPIAYALPEGYVLITPDQLTEILAEFEKRLADAKRSVLAAGIAQVDSEVIDGYPISVILQRQEQRGHDLIVMGTHGRSGIKRLVLGSVAENVLRSAKCPVLLVRGEASARTSSAPAVQQAPG
jgi:nucleotide-binding universal stress UspA family protein